MAYEVKLTSAVLRDLARLPMSVGTRILDEVEALAQEPDPIRHVKRLKGGGQNPFYSLRVGRYRAILNIYDDVLLIIVVELRSPVKDLPEALTWSKHLPGSPPGSPSSRGRAILNMTDG